MRNNVNEQPEQVVIEDSSMLVRRIKKSFRAVNDIIITIDFRSSLFHVRLILHNVGDIAKLSLLMVILIYHCQIYANMNWN